MSNIIGMLGGYVSGVVDSVVNGGGIFSEVGGWVVVKYLSYTLLGLAVPTVIALMSGQKAGYGRYTSKSTSFSFHIPGKLAWIVQESPSVLFGWVMILFHLTNAQSMASIPNLILLGLFQLHYIHRTFIFPFQLKGKPSELSIVFMAFIFCMLNGYLQHMWLLKLHVYPESWVYDPRFIIGILLFFLGMGINIHSDYTLLGLKKSSKNQGYKIPRGGMFEYVSGANFFGEILEWTGFAIASWSLPALTFAVFTMSNIGPRGYQHHLWYHEKFEDYPKNRKAIIPFVW
eukprot:m.45389 g.45389  ORF g.45389 m.45389 type:complete len:287 (-) comp7216_c0_seq2:160-1020(-)